MTVRTGEKAKDIALEDQDGKEIHLSDLRRKSDLINLSGK